MGHCFLGSDVGKSRYLELGPDTVKPRDGGIFIGNYSIQENDLVNCVTQYTADVNIALICILS